ncbi:MAG: response regulator transcription factor [Solobacterium sp.]|nr:response regulator transcription factor [Solobacterium sp.]
MLKTVLIEDEDDVRRYLTRQLKAAFAALHEELQVLEYPDGESFLKRMSGCLDSDVLFLDIEMPGMDGITLAERIRRSMPHVLIVFISSQDQLVFRSFTVQPFRFVRKQYFDRELEGLVKDLAEAVKQRRKTMIYLTEPGTGDIYSFDLAELLYVEAQRKDCRLVSRSGEQWIRCPLRSIKEKLEPCHFLACHRSYLVSWRAVYRIGKTDILLVNNETLPLSRGLAESFKADFIRLTRTEVQ